VLSVLIYRYNKYDEVVVEAANSAGYGQIALLDEIRSKSDTWEVLAPRWGVTNPNPPWKTSLTAMCDCLGGVLPNEDRRNAEDMLADNIYRDVPAPERQLLALAHTMLNRGLMTEEQLAIRMRSVRERLEAV
jgi:hypothetical protein